MSEEKRTWMISMISPTLEEVKEYRDDGRYTICPVYREILSDFKTPIEVMRVLLNADQHCFMLESADASKKWGRYTFLGFGSKVNITA